MTSSLGSGQVNGHATTFTGRGQEVFQAAVIKSAIGLYLRTGMKANRAYTVRNMKAMAAKITGLPVRNLQEAERLLGVWIEAEKIMAYATGDIR